MKVFEFLCGAIIVAIVLSDVFQSVVVPRSTPRTLRLAPFIVKSIWPLWRQCGQKLGSRHRREYFLAIFAPLALILELLVWVIALILGYGLMLYALGSLVKPAINDLGSALYLAGTSLFTLGFGDLVPLGFARFIVLAAAASGVAVMSLVIALLFSLYKSFQQREALVVLLDARAGTPPSGAMLLETYAQLNLFGELPITFAAWEVWSAEVFESHRAYPILPFFRSTLEQNSWLSALGAILDAGTLLLTAIESDDYGSAYLMYSVGCRVVLDLNRLFQLKANNEVGVERQQFEQARARLGRAGFRLRPAEESWQAFVEMRSTYGGALNSLASYFATPPIIWGRSHLNLPHSSHLCRPQGTVQ